MTSYRILPYVFWVLGAALFVLGFIRWRKERMTRVKKEKPDIYGIKQKMKNDWNRGSTAGEDFGLMVRQKVIGLFKRGSNAPKN